MVVCAAGRFGRDPSVFKCHWGYSCNGKFNRKGASPWDNVGILHEYCCSEFSGIYLVKAGNDMEVTCYHFYIIADLIHGSRVANKFNLCGVRGTYERNRSAWQWVCKMRQNR